MTELKERLDTIIEILEEMDNAATPMLVEAIQMAKKMIAEKRPDEKARSKAAHLEKRKQKFNDDLVKFSAAFDNVFDQFLTQLFKQNLKDDKRFRK